jgi:hypothetical protein
MKYIAIIALAAVAFTLGACSSKNESATVSHSATTGYSK